MADQTVSYLLQAKTQGLSDLQLFRNELAQLKQIASGFKADVGFGQQQVASMKAATQAVTEQIKAVTQLTAALRAQGRMNTITIKVEGTQKAINDVGTLRTILGALQTSTNIRITTDVTALQAVNTQINTQIAQLTALIAQLRGLGGGGPGPGPGGAGGLPAGVRATILEIERLNNLFTRGQISGQNYSMALTAMQGRLEAARSAAGRGSEDFAAIDKQITKLTQSLRGINTDSLQKVRTDMAGVRTAFDSATAGISRDSQQFRDAAAVYQTGAAQIEARLRAMAAQGNLTASQMGQVNRMLGTLAREQGTLTGGLNPMGLSGNVFNALRAAFPIIQQMGGSLGAAASQGGMLAQGFGSAGAAAGVMGVAVLGATAAVAGIGLVAMNTTKVFASFEHSMQGVKAVSDTSGKTFDALKGQALTLAQTFGVSLETIAQAQEELFKAGRTTEDVMGGAARGVIVLSKATGTDLLNAVSIASSAMNVFGLKGTDMGMVADVIANGANKTALDVNTLGVSLQQVGNVAASSGLNLQETVAVLGMMADKGMAGSDAGTSLKTMLQRLKSPTDEANAALLKHGVAVYDATGKQRDMIDILKDTIGSMNGMTDSQRNAFAQTVFGADAVRSITVMYSNGAVKLDEYIKNVDEKGRAERDAKTRAEGLTGSQEKLNASMQVFKTSVGELFSGPMLNAINNMERLVVSATRIIDNLHGANVELQEWGQQVGIDVSRLSAADQNKAQIDLVQLQGNISVEQRRIYMQELEKFRLSAVQTQGGGTFSGSGPLLPGQTRGAAADAAGLRILDATTTATGNHAADDLIGWCARWVKLTLEKAQPGAKAQIERWFGGDADTVKNRLLASEKLQKYSGNVNDLAPGDVVVYDKNHIGIYIGNGMVRGNNEWGGKNGAAITDEKINSLGSIAGIVKAIDAASGFTARAQKGGATDLTPPVLPITDKQIAQAQKYAAALEAAQKAFKANPESAAAIKAVDAARVAMDGWSKASEGNARALAIVQENQKGAARAAGQYVVTQADLNTYGAKALQLIKAQEVANKSGNDAAIARANADMAAFTKDSARRAAVVQVEQAAYQSRQQASKQSEQENAANALALAEKVAQGKVTATQTVLERLKQAQSDELAGADTNARKLAVIQKTSAAIYKGELALAEAERQKAYAAAEGDKTPALKAQDRADADAAYEKAKAAAGLEQTRALNAAQRSAEEDHKRAVEAQEKARQQVVQQARDLDLKGAQLSFSRLKQLRDAELRDAGDNVVKKLAIQERYRLDLQHSQEAIALTQLKIDKAAANSGPAQNRAKGISNAYTTYYQALFDAKDTSEVTKATSDQTDAVRKQRDAYSKLADQMRDAVKAGGMDAEAKHEWMVAFNSLGRETEKLGLTNDHYVEGARKATFALTTQSDSIRASLGSINEAVTQTDTLLDGLDARLQDMRETEQVVSDLRQAALGQGIPLSAPPIDNRETDPTPRPNSAASDYLQALGLAPDAFAALASTTIPDAMQEATTPEQYAGLGAVVLRGLVDGLADKTGWEKVRDAMQLGLNQALETDSLVMQAPVVPGVRTGNERDDYVGFGDQLTPAPQTDWEKNQTQINRQGIFDSLKSMDREQLDAEKAFAAGAKDVELYNAVLAELKDRADKAAKAVQDLAEKMAKDQEDATAKAVKSTEDFMKAQQQVGDAEAKVGEAMGEKQPLYRSEIQALENLKLQYPELAARIQLVIDAYLQLRKAGELDDLAAGAEKLGQGLASIFDGFGMSDWGKITSSLGSIPKLLKSGMDAASDFQDNWKKFSGDKTLGNLGGLLGSIGGAAGVVGAAISLIGGLGDAIMGLDPAYQLWKKNTLEQASAEQQAMGSKTYGNIANPYYDRLKQDSEALTTKANAGFWQRLGWSLFGGAPETLDKAASDALVKASNIFSDFAQSINGTLESVLIDATDSADFSGVGDALDKQMNKLIQTYALRAIIAKSNLSKFIQDFADDSAAGKDTTADLANIRGEQGRITSSYQAIAPSLPGYGSSTNTDGNSTSSASSSTFGSTPSSVGYAVPTGLIESAQQHLAAGNLALSAAQLSDISTRRFDGSTVRFDGTVARLEARLDAMARGGGSSGLGTLSGR